MTEEYIAGNSNKITKKEWVNTLEKKISKTISTGSTKFISTFKSIRFTRYADN